MENKFEDLIKKAKETSNPAKFAEYLEKALEIRPYDLTIAHSLFEHYLTWGPVEKAKEILKKVENRRKSLLYYYMKGRLYERRRWYKKAIECYSKALLEGVKYEEDEKQPVLMANVFKRRAELLARRKEYHKAIDDYRDAYNYLLKVIEE